MYKANGRLAEGLFRKSQIDNRVEKIKTLKQDFSRKGIFEPFKHTSSYAEIPPVTNTLDSATYIRRQYKNVELVTLGSTLYFVECKELNKYLAVKPRYYMLGKTALKVIRAEACFRYLNKEGQKFQQELLNNWEDLTQPVFSYRSM